MNPDNMDATLADLEQTSNRLADSVRSLSGRLKTTEEVTAQLEQQQLLLQEQQDQQKTQKRINGWLMFSIFLDVALSIALAFAAARIDHNADALNKIQEQVSAEVLCPQYQLWLSLLIERRGDPELTPKQMEQLEDFARVFERGYRSLRCAPPLPD
jgi:hypothetical protein